MRWDQIHRKELDQYGRHLLQLNLAPRTLYLELTTIKSVNKHLIQNQRLAEDLRLETNLRRPLGSDTYRYTIKEVQAMLALCRTDPKLFWLDAVIRTLITRGLRIAEVASLTWNDIKRDQQEQPTFISLTDDRASAKRKVHSTQRRIKGRRGRVIPIHPSLRVLLNELPRHPDGRIFHGPNGGKLKPDTVRHCFERSIITPLSPRFAASKDQVEFADGRLHSFRHDFVSQAFLQDATESEI